MSPACAGASLGRRSSISLKIFRNSSLCTTTSANRNVTHRAEQGGVKLELELPDRLPALRADQRKLKQILVNLLSNAIQFTDAGGEVAL